MKNAGIVPDVIAWTPLLHAKKKPEQRQKIMNQMIDSALCPDVVAWNLLLQSQRTPPAMRRVLSDMQAAGITSNSATYVIYFNCLLKNNHGDEVISLYHNHLKGTPAAKLINSAVATAVFCALGNVGNTDEIATFWHSFKDLLYT